MTPARLAEIRAYINRLDLDQLPGWTVEQRIIADLWEAQEAVRELTGGPFSEGYWPYAVELEDGGHFAVLLDDLRDALDGGTRADAS
jgi:hypothetical protein